MSEPDKVNNKVIDTAVLSTIVLLLVMVFGVYQLFQFGVQDEIRRKVDSLPSEQLRELDATDVARLNRYQWIEQPSGNKAGVLRVPTERAIDLILAEGYQRNVPGPGPGPGPDGGAGP